jgi:carboxyl-terminal processing protease
MKRRLYVLGAGGLVLLALLVGLAGGVLLERQVLSDAVPSVLVPAGTRPQFQLMVEVWRIIEREYVNREEIEPRNMAYGAVDGMVQTLGDAGHTRFLTPEMAQRHQRQIEGAFQGIGAYVEMRDGRVVIVAPIDDSPAQKAGLESGDVILEVNGEDVAALPLTEVTLTILDPDTGQTREVTVQRAEIDLDLVSWQRLPGTKLAYVRISAFSEGATEELEQTLAEIEQEGIDGLMLDLRDNPGGLLNEAVGVASHFVESGDVLLRRDADGNVEAETVRRGVATVDLRMVTLVNGGTASAAEIVTGALQDQDRATVVGTTTFGAGTVLNQFTLSDDSLLLLAVEEWLTPDGRVIWMEGLAPDVEVPLPADAEPLRLRFEEFTEQELRKSEDEQLLRALELLESSESQ